MNGVRVTEHTYYGLRIYIHMIHRFDRIDLEFGIGMGTNWEPMNIKISIPILELRFNAHKVRV